jgi:hypothetical protein
VNTTSNPLGIPSAAEGRVIFNQLPFSVNQEFETSNGTIISCGNPNLNGPRQQEIRD